MMFKQEDAQKGPELNAMFASKLPQNLDYFFTRAQTEPTPTSIQFRIGILYAEFFGYCWTRWFAKESRPVAVVPGIRRTLDFTL